MTSAAAIVVESRLVTYPFKPIVRRLSATPWRVSSKVIRDADHLRVRRTASVSAITSAGVALGWRMRGAAATGEISMWLDYGSV